LLARLRESCGYKAADEQALKAARGWRFPTDPDADDRRRFAAAALTWLPVRIHWEPLPPLP
jgi:outer membrane biosynthesis protein TonB